MIRFLRDVSTNALGTVLGAALVTLAGIAKLAESGNLDWASPSVSEFLALWLAPVLEAWAPNWLVGILGLCCFGLGFKLLRERTQIVRVSVDDSFYSGPHPYADQHPASNVIYQIAITNRTDQPLTITSVKLHIEGRQPLASSDLGTDDQNKKQFLIPRGGGFSSIPTKSRWWRLPQSLEPRQSHVGWIGFTFGEPQDKLLFREARCLDAWLIVAPSTGNSVRLVAPPCVMPDLSNHAQRRLWQIDEEIEELRKLVAGAEEQMTGLGDRSDGDANNDLSHYMQLLSEKEQERKLAVEHLT